MMASRPAPPHPTHQRLRSRDTGFARAADIGQIDDLGVAIPIDQFRANCQKKGLCVTCGRVKTHVKKAGLGGFTMTPLTREGEVFEGYCLACHTMEVILEIPEIKAKLEKKAAKKAGRSWVVGRSGSSASNQGSTSSIRSQGSVSRQEKQDETSDAARSNRSLAMSSVDGNEQSSPSTLDASSPPRGMEDIIESMFDDPMNPVTQARGCAELSRMSNHPADCLIGAIDAIVEAMNNHPDDDRVQKEGCRSFRKYTGSNSGGASLSAGEEITVNEDCCNKICVQGGIYSLIQALRAHAKSRTIQREGIRAIRNLLCALTDSRTAILDTGGVELIIRAMWAHDTLASVQEDGCIILWSLAYEDESAQTQILENNGVPAVLNAMTVYRGQEKVQHHGCGALHTLSMNEELKRYILDNGGMEVIMNSILEHGYSEVVCEKAIGALVNLVVSTGGEKNKLCVLSMNEIDAVVKAMQTHTSSAKVQKTACYFLEIAARSRSNLALLRENKHVQKALLEATKNCPEETLEHANYVLSMIEGHSI